MKMVLIVDDERLIRNGVKAMLERKKSKYYEIDLCSNGKEALEMAQSKNYDIIITDIRMPQMDGLTFIKNLKGDEFTPFIIILSGYDDFNYAVEAIKCGARDYLLKPIKREELYSCLDRFEVESHHKKNSEDKQASSKLYLEDLLAAELNLIFMKKDITKNAIIDTIERLNIKIFEKGYYLGLVTTETELNNILEEYSGNYPAEEIKYFKSDSGLVIISNNSNIYKFIELRYQNENNYNFCIGISDLCFGAGEIKEAYFQALEAAKYRLFNYKTGVKFIKYSEVLSKKKSYEIPMDKINKLNNMLGTERESEIEKLICEIFSESKIKDLDITYFEEINNQINTIILENIQTRFFYKDEEHTIKFKKFRDVYNFENLKIYIQELKKFINYVNQYVLAVKEIYVDNKNIEKAIEYIKDHYYEELSLARVSNEVSLNYSYFSQKFKEYTKDSFVNYIKKLRIEKAKELLVMGEYKIYEIAKKVGYDDPKQFTKNFRSLTGISPIEYRENTVAR